MYLFFYLFFGKNGEVYRWRVCYQRGLPRLVPQHVAVVLSDYVQERDAGHLHRPDVPEDPAGVRGGQDLPGPDRPQVHTAKVSLISVWEVLPEEVETREAQIPECDENPSSSQSPCQPMIICQRSACG